MEPRDAAKLCWQAAFGAEHLLASRESAQAYFDGEYAAAAADGGPLFERISPAYCRCNIGEWKRRALPPEWLFEMFFLTASGGGAATAADVTALLDAVGALAAAGRLPFGAEAWAAYRAGYEATGRGPVHHSAAYRAAERPAYRVTAARYEALLPVLERMAAGARVIAVDGRAASGKTTLAADIAAVAGAGVIHTDDFFLPPGMRSPERLAEPGGNVHYERFAAEILPRLRDGAAFAYRRFDCGLMALSGERAVAASPWRVVEGAYSCHPVFGDYADCRVFCDVEPEEQLRRIRLRDGEAAVAAFTERWIPMEERYLAAFSVRRSADAELRL